MAEFFPDLLDEFPGTEFLEKVCMKFHYEKERMEELRKVAEKMQPLIRRDGLWERRKSAPGYSLKPQTADAVYEEVVMSLGKGIDDLQEDFHGKGMLSESYMLEVLAGELLLAGYGAYNREVIEKGNRHVAGYHFPGSEEELPLKMVPELLHAFHSPVTCNEAFCLIPKKSVVFLAELTCDSAIQCESICTGCQNTHCPNRVEDDPLRGHMLTRMADMPLTYGYSRILGRSY